MFPLVSVRVYVYVLLDPNKAIVIEPLLLLHVELLVVTEIIDYEFGESNVVVSVNVHNPASVTTTLKNPLPNPVKI